MTLDRSVAAEVGDVSMERPHVVLVGAGASRAAFPNGDRHGRLLPVMTDFYRTTGIGDVLAEKGIAWEGRNFEELYSLLATTPEMAETRRTVERAIFAYFAAMELPDGPTLFDHLVLSLRPKDVIATFNWDPFLIQAARRNLHVGGHPRILFLHGNVLEGYCARDRVHGVRGARCSRCGRPFETGRLLYPVAEKDYESDPAIRSSWEFVRLAFKDAFMVTVFGYGAPKSDRGAVDLLLDAWGGWQERNMEQFEVIDIRPEEELVESWSPFIHTHHYEVHRDFFDSWIAAHPRRTGEAYWSQYQEANWIDDHPAPRGGTLSDLWEWFRPLIAAESRAASESKRPAAEASDPRSK